MEEATGHAVAWRPGDVARIRAHLLADGRAVAGNLFRTADALTTQLSGDVDVPLKLVDRAAGLTA